MKRSLSQYNPQNTYLHSSMRHTGSRLNHLMRACIGNMCLPHLYLKSLVIVGLSAVGTARLQGGDSSSRPLGIHLCLESLSLVYRVCQLREGIRQLSPYNTWPEEFVPASLAKLLVGLLLVATRAIDNTKVPNKDMVDAESRASSHSCGQCWAQSIACQMAKHGWNAFRLS